MSHVDLTLWPACVRAHPVNDQIVAAQKAGFSALAINSAGYLAALSDGMTGPQIGQIARDNDMRISWVDAVSGWLPVRYPPRSPELKDFLDHDLDIAFEIADAFGAKSLLAIGCFDHGHVDRAQQIDCFAALCERAASSGLRVGLEFIPMWGIPSLRCALEILDEVRAENAGLVFDSWHFFRSDPDIELLATVPAGKVLAVQLADARWKVSGSNLQEDCLACRCQPGEGEFPLDSILAHLAANGVDDFGPEVFSEELDSMTADRAAEASAAATRNILEATGINIA